MRTHEPTPDWDADLAAWRAGDDGELEHPDDTEDPRIAEAEARR